MLICTAIFFAGLVLLAYCLRTRRPAHAIYAYLAAWIICPKLARLANLGNFPAGLADHIFIYDYVNAVTALVLLVLCFCIRPRVRPPYGRFIMKLLRVFVLMTVVSFCSGLWFRATWRSNLELREFFIQPALSMLYQAIFGWAFVNYIDSRRKVEWVLALLALSGVELTAEAILLYYHDWFPAIRVHLLSVDGRFQSLTFLSFSSVGLVCIIAICATLYFAVTRSSLVLCLVAVLMLVPIFGTAERGPLVGAVLGMSVMALLCLPKRFRRILAGMGTAAFVASAWFVSVHAGNLANVVNSELGGTTGANSPVESTFLTRLGLCFRGLDLIAHNFPFGTGNGAAQYQMAEPIPERFDPTWSEQVHLAYRAAVTGAHITSTHNAFMEIVVENGFLGIVFLGLSALVLAGNFKSFCRLRRRHGNQIYVAQACIYACFAGAIWRYCFEPGDKLYFLLFAMLAMTSLLPTLHAGGVGPAPAAPQMAEAPTTT